MTAPGAGRARASLRRGRAVIARAARRVRRGRPATLRLRPASGLRGARTLALVIRAGDARERRKIVLRG